MTRTIELSATPTLGPMLAKAAATGFIRKGRALPDVRVVQHDLRIDQNALAAYDQVCGFPVTHLVSSTYLHVLVFPLQVTLMADKEFPFPLLGSVHLTNTITQHRRVDALEVLDLEVTVENLRPHFRGAQADLIGRIRVGDEVVWEEVSTYLFRGQKVPGEVPPKPQEVEPIDGPGIVWPLTADLGRRYAAVSGDVNPIHMHPLTAKALGFPTTIVHGMWSKSRMLAAVENRLPEAYTIHVEFKKPVLIPGKVRFIARETPAGGWDLALRAARKDSVHAVGTITPGS
ncbi:MaoC family dehydratase [Calidifontibacter terrae]